MKKVLFTATVDSHILQFHLPFLKLFKEMGYEVHVATNGNEKIPYCDVKHVVSFERSPFKLNNLRAIKQLKKICNEEKFDIIHTHTPMGSVVTRLAAKKARKKYHTRVIYTAHGLHFFKGAPKKNWLLFYPVEKYLSKFTDTLILINQEDYDLCKRKFKKCRDIQYVPGVGIDEEKFNFKFSNNDKIKLRKSLGIKENDFVIIYPAEISKRKRQIWLINTISDLLKKYDDIHLLLPGKDSLNGKCQELVNKLGLDKQIHFLGYRKDIPKLLKISDISVSAANQEGLPVNIMEAMYVGLPIVASNCRGNRDLVHDEKNGYLVELNDENRFFKSIEKVYSNSTETQKFISNGKMIIQNYLLPSILKMMIDIYDNKKKEDDLITIVIPVYNVEKYLGRCIDSVIKQTYKNIEIILVDDGATDQSGNICDEYAEKDKRIKVIHKKNGGLSDARNAGIDIATGKYISFIDGDDFVADNYVEKLYNLIKKNNSDVSVCIWKKIFEDGKTKKSYFTFFHREITSNNYIMLQHMLYQKLFDTSACAKLYDISLFNNIRYPKGKLYEDLATTYKLFLKSKKITYSNDVIYYYFVRNNSITQSNFKEKDMDLIEISDTLLQSLKEIDKKMGLKNKLTNAAISRYLSGNFTILKKTNVHKLKKYNDTCIQNIKKYGRFNIHSRLKNNIALLLFKIDPNLIK